MQCYINIWRWHTLLSPSFSLTTRLSSFIQFHLSYYFYFLSVIFCTCSLSHLITFPLAISSPDPLTKLVRPPEWQGLDREAPVLSKSQVQRHPVNSFLGMTSMKFQATVCTLGCILPLFALTLIFFVFLATVICAQPSFLPFLPFSPVSELSLADSPHGSIILQHLSAVCLHRGSCAAIGPQGTKPTINSCIVLF